MAAVITSITGLQNLPELRVFSADYSGLESVNLSGLTNLVDVDISDCDFPGDNTSSLTSVNLSGCTALEELRLDDSNFSGGIPNLSGLDSLIYMDFDQCGITGSVDISNHPVLEGFDFSGNTGLTELIISDTQPLGGNGYELLIYNCALTQTAVDNILVALSESAVENGYVDLSSGNNASPSQVGIDAANVLSDKSWSFDYNVTPINYTVSNQSSLTRDCELFPNIGVYSLQSNPLQVVRFYNNSNLTSPFLGTADAFFTFVLFDESENVYTANIDPVTGDVSNIQLCVEPTTTTTTSTSTTTTTTTSGPTSYTVEYSDGDVCTSVSGTRTLEGDASSFCDCTVFTNTIASMNTIKFGTNVLTVVPRNPIDPNIADVVGSCTTC